jgi:hypothetical protein
MRLKSNPIERFTGVTSSFFPPNIARHFLHLVVFNNQSSSTFHPLPKPSSSSSAVPIGPEELVLKKSSRRLVRCKQLARVLGHVTGGLQVAGREARKAAVRGSAEGRGNVRPDSDIRKSGLKRRKALQRQIASTNSKLDLTREARNDETCHRIRDEQREPGASYTRDINALTVPSIRKAAGYRRAIGCLSLREQYGPGP